MKIKHLTPTPHTIKLEELSRGMVFRFQNASTPYMMLSAITGDEIKAMYKQRHGGAEDMLGDIEIYDENLYIWTEDENELDEDEYLHNSEDEELIAYVRFDDGRILLSHRHEIVIPLNAELAVEDMRSLD